MRPPELTPFETGFDDGDPTRPFEKYAVTTRLGQFQILPGLTTTVGGYNGIFPGPTIRARTGTRTEVRIRNGFPATGLLFPQAIRISTHNHGLDAFALGRRDAEQMAFRGRPLALVSIPTGSGG